MRIAAGRFKGRRLPEAVDARPVGGRLKTSLFSMLAADLEGARVLDLCAGVGGLGLEALSRGAASVVLVEQSPPAAAALQAWIARVGCAAEARVVRGDALGAPPVEERFDIVFLDPPFEVWAAGEPGEIVSRALESVLAGGLLVEKLPAKTVIPDEPARRPLRRRTVGEAAGAVFLRL